MEPEEIKLKVWHNRLDGPDNERHVLDGDWRDPDIAIDLTGCQLYPKDGSSSWESTDWSKGWALRRGDREIGIEGVGKPPSPYFEAFQQGRVLQGIVIARDEQRHGR